MANPDSVTQWLVDLKGGNGDAAQKLWDRYFAKLAVLARKKLDSAPRLPTDGEDVALSALHSLCRGVGQGRFPDLEDREGLWKLLVTMTVRKAQKAVRDEFRQKRGGGHVVGGSVFLTREEAESGMRGLEMVLDREPSPEFVVEVAEEWQRLLDRLPDDELKRIALWRMEGLTTVEIATRLGKALATVERRLRLIRSLWTEEVAV
ncbi:MAG: ECF-type sigma factor [Planctomycetota bacterium]|nr:ECF-type sigma factor [Planctomycetota bacterium]